MTDVAKTQQNRPCAALTVAGSDSSGGAGIQADLKTFAAFGVHGASALTALTAQNTLSVQDVRVMDPPFVAAQIAACLDDLPIRAVKTGMLADAGIVHAVAGALASVRQQQGETIPLILDPVMVATSGARLLDDDAVQILIEELLPLAALITPNLPEAAALTGLPGDSEPERLGAALLESGARAVLIKGGHASGETCRDLLVTPAEVKSLEWRRTEGEFHGTGCAYAAAIAALVARDEPLGRAVQRAGEWLQQQIRHAFRPARGTLGILPFEAAGPR